MSLTMVVLSGIVGPLVVGNYIPLKENDSIKSPLFNTRLLHYIPSNRLYLSESNYLAREIQPDEGNFSEYDINITIEGELGENNWYVSPVNITFTFNESEITALFYRIGNDSFVQYIDTFQIETDGIHSIEWFIIDQFGNSSEIQSFEVKIDQVSPIVDTNWESGGGRWKLGVFTIIFTATASDSTSGVNYTKFELVGPTTILHFDDSFPYEWYCEFLIPEINLKVKGLILRREITTDNISFYALRVKVSNDGRWVIRSHAYDFAGNHGYDMITSVLRNPPVYYFRWFTFPNNYTGDIGLFYVNAQFAYGPIDTRFGGLFE